MAILDLKDISTMITLIETESIILFPKPTNKIKLKNMVE
jgi:hypothetical protein